MQNNQSMASPQMVYHQCPNSKLSIKYFYVKLAIDSITQRPVAAKMWRQLSGGSLPLGYIYKNIISLTCRTVKEPIQCSYRPVGGRFNGRFNAIVLIVQNPLPVIKQTISELNPPWQFVGTSLFVPIFVIFAYEVLCNEKMMDFTDFLDLCTLISQGLFTY